MNERAMNGSEANEELQYNSESFKFPDQFIIRIPSNNSTLPTLFIFLDCPFGITALINNKLVAFDPSIIYIKVDTKTESVIYEESSKPIHDEITELLDRHPFIKELPFSSLLPTSFIALRFQPINLSPYEACPDFYSYTFLGMSITNELDTSEEIAQFYLETGFSSISSRCKLQYEASFLLNQQIMHPYEFEGQITNICRLLHLKNIRLESTLHPNKRILVLNKQQPIVQLLINALYCRFLRDQLFRSRQEGTEHRLKILLTLPYVNDGQNEYFKLHSFIDELTESTFKNGVKDLHTHVLAYIQRISPKPLIQYDLFETNDDIYLLLCDEKFCIFGNNQRNDSFRFINEYLDGSKLEGKYIEDKINSLLDSAIVLANSSRHKYHHNQYIHISNEQVKGAVEGISNYNSDYFLDKAKINELFSQRVEINAHQLSKQAISGCFRGWVQVAPIGWFANDIEGDREKIRLKLGKLWGYEQEISIKTVVIDREKKWELE